MADLFVTIKDLRAGFSLPTGRMHNLTLRSVVSRIRLVGMFFDLNKCFLLPSAMHGIREVKRHYDRNPEQKLLVVGHTDTSGKDSYNLTLSLERAEALAAYLKDDVDAWDAFFGAAKPSEKRWGLLEVQQMLTALPDGKPAFFGGAPNGVDSKSWRVAVRAFQKAHGLAIDGVVGPVTRKAVVRDYMALDGTTLPRGVELITHGCGENFPVDQTGDSARSPENRRVEIFFFEDAVVPEPPGKTSARGSTEYPLWRKQVKQTIDVVLGTSSSVAGLKSRYALDRFEQLAAEMKKKDFIAWASVSYGTDIPLSAYEALHDVLIKKSLTPPEIQLVPGGIDGMDSAYDNATEIIGVREEVALAAKDQDAAAGELVILLMHEFGHHVDRLLRHRFSSVGGDTKGEEGNAFAFAVTAMHHVDTGRVSFATLVKDGNETELSLEFVEFHQAVKVYLNDAAAQKEAMRETVEFFGAGRGNPRFPSSSFGHRSIEDGLGKADPGFYTQPVRDEIYFGNWLRDFSQFNDPAWLRFFKNGFADAVREAEDLVVELLDVAAKSDFDPQASPTQHEGGPFRVTTANLGVYRAEEHIDNPEGMKDGSTIDPRFRGSVAPIELALDPKTGLKAYIATRGLGFVTSADFIERSLRAALSAGFTPEGRRLFGQALHTLEDLYAHSNFVELSLIRLGHRSVFPWVGINAFVGGKLTFRKPLVTGVFGLVDTGVSGASVLGESLEKPIECEAGVFSASSVAVVKLMRAVTPREAKSIESLFVKVRDLEKKYPKYATALCRMTDDLRLWIRAKLGTAIREQIVLLHQKEEAFFNDPTSTAPTHSQLAKDHDDHPLHSIAAQCAQAVVADLGLAMRDAWREKAATDADKVVQRALRYLVHPDDISLVQSPAPGPELLLGLIKKFADDNPSVVNSLDLQGSKARFLKHAEADRVRRLEEARTMYARNEVNADRTAELISSA